MTWRRDLWGHRVIVSLEMCHDCWLNSYGKFGGAANTRRRFFAICEKPEGGRITAPPPGCARVKSRLWLAQIRCYRRSITDIGGLEQCASVIPVHVSDHDVVMLDAPLPRIRRPTRTVTVRSLRNVDYDSLRLDLFMANWEPVYRAPCTSTKYDAFLIVWNGCIDLHCPENCAFPASMPGAEPRLKKWVGQLDVRGALSEQGQHHSKGALVANARFQRCSA